MKILMVPSAKEEIRLLQNFVDLVENYEANSLKKWIIKEYAYTSSIRVVANRAIEKGLRINGQVFDEAFVREIIDANPKDENSWGKNKVNLIQKNTEISTVFFVYLLFILV